MDRQPRVDDFLRNIREPAICVPDSSADFGMFERIEVAFDGVAQQLEEYRRNQGKIGYTGQNLMSDLSKASVEASMRGDAIEEAFLENEMTKLALGFRNVSDEGELAENSNRFERTIWQEKLEADTFRVTWPVIVGKTDFVPKLIPWSEFDGNIQAYLYGFLDVVSELGKAVGDEMAKPDMTTEVEFQVIERYLAISHSITLQLSRHRHTPGYVINNAFGHWAAYTTKLRTAYGTMAFVRRDYSLRRSNQRMHKAAEDRLTIKLNDILEIVNAARLLNSL